MAIRLARKFCSLPLLFQGNLSSSERRITGIENYGQSVIFSTIKLRRYGILQLKKFYLMKMVGSEQSK